MELHCRYHPTRVPVLMCSQCSNTVCPDCVPEWPDRGNPRCVSCRAEMEPLGIIEYIKPFWQCFDRFFNFPFKKGNLIFLGLVFILSFLLPGIDEESKVTGFGFIFKLLTWVLFPSFIVAYLSAITIEASEGKDEPPNIASIWKDGGFSLFIKAIMTIWIFAIIFGLVSSFFGAALAGLFLLFGALAFPAVLMLLVMEKEVRSALDFRRIISIIQSIGWPYMFLWGFLMMLISGPDILTDVPEYVWNSGLFVRFVILLHVFFGMVMFHLLGYVAYQYHYELGIDLSGEQMESIKDNKRNVHPVLVESELLIVEGHYHSAKELLEKTLKENPQQEMLWRKLFALSELTFAFEETLKVAGDYMKHLSENNQNSKIVQIVRKLIRNKPGLKLTDFKAPEEIKKLLEEQEEIELLIQLS